MNTRSPLPPIHKSPPPRSASGWIRSPNPGAKYEPKSISAFLEKKSAPYRTQRQRKEPVVFRTRHRSPHRNQSGWFGARTKTLRQPPRSKPSRDRDERAPRRDPTMNRRRRRRGPARSTHLMPVWTVFCHGASAGTTVDAAALASRYLSGRYFWPGASRHLAQEGNRTRMDTTSCRRAGNLREGVRTAHRRRPPRPLNRGSR